MFENDARFKELNMTEFIFKTIPDITIGRIQYVDRSTPGQGKSLSKIHGLGLQIFSFHTIGLRAVAQQVYCVYHRLDCREQWTPKLTMHGFCIGKVTHINFLHFKPPFSVFNKDTEMEPHPKISVGRQTSLTRAFKFMCFS